MNKKSLFIIPLSVLMLVGCNGKNSGGSTTPVEETFTVVWKNYDGAVLETDTGLKKGEMPHYDGDTPSRVATAQYTYTFEGWSPEVVAVTADAEYTATYSRALNSYTVTWVVNGETVKTEPVEYGSTVAWTAADPTKASTAEYDYTFNGWDYNLATPITGNTTITAQFTPVKRSYTITFLNSDGSEIEHHSVEYGEMPSCSVTPEKAGDATYNYDFAGWDNELVSVTGAATYTATYTAVPLDFSDMGTYYRCNGLKNNAYSGEVNIPSTWKGKPVQSIYEYGFAGCQGITSVTIPTSVTEIGARAFQNSSITSISIPGSVEVIPEDLCYNCSKLANLELHEGTKTIAAEAFMSTAIRELTLVDSLTSIGNNSFGECKQLLRIISASGDGFADCTTNSYAFAYSGCLTEFINNTSLSADVIRSKLGSQSGYYYVYRITTAENAGTFEFEENAANSGDFKRIFYTYPDSSDIYLVGAFGNGTTLRTGKATRVKTFAFYHRDDIVHLYIGSSIVQMGLEKSAFNSAYSIEDVTFEGNDYLDIGHSCFRDCRSLATVNWGTRKVDAIRGLAFASCRSLVVTLPTACPELVLYSEAFTETIGTSLEVTANVKAIDGNPFCKMPNLTTLTVETGNAYYKAVDNVLFTLDGKKLVAYATNKPETSYAIPSGTEVTGDYSMNSVKNLQTISLPLSLTKVGYASLVGADAITAISYEGTVTDCGNITGINTWWKPSQISTITCSDGTWPA